MMPMFGFLGQVLVLMIIVRLVTRDPGLDFQSCVLWGLIAGAVAMVVHLAFGVGLLKLPDPVPDIAGALSAFGAVIGILWHQGYAWSEVWTIRRLDSHPGGFDCRRARHQPLLTLKLVS
jgi:hypothetical protein